MVIKEYGDALHFYENFGFETQCCEDGCDLQPKYNLQWFSVNQFGRNKLNLVEVFSCQNPVHFYGIAKEVYDTFGGCERVIDLNNKIEKPRLQDLLNTVLSVKSPTLQTLRAIILIGDPNENQLNFSFQKGHHSQ